MPTNNGRVKSWRKKKQSNIDCIPVFGFLLKKCVKMLLCHCFITIFTVFMKLFFERNAKYQAPEQFQQIIKIFQFFSHLIQIRYCWQNSENEREKNTQFFFNYIASISHQTTLLFCISPLLSNRDICVIPIAPF